MESLDKEAARRRIEPTLFYRCLVEALSERREDVSRLWDSSSAYTKFIFGEVLPEVARRLGLSFYPKDYYTLDCIYYDERDCEHFLIGDIYAKYLAIAVEHENELSGTCIEMNKLQIFNAPLKVLITYIGPQKTKNIDIYLAKYTKIIKSADIFDDVASLRRQLVVFGERPKRGSFAVWRGFVYEQDGFVQI